MKGTPLKRTPMKRRYVNTGPDLETVMLVLQRDGYRCVRCGKPAQGDRGVDWSIQHRKKRSAGVDNRPCNLIVLCGSGTTLCHGWVEGHPTLAAHEGGWSVSRYADPAEVPVLVDRGSRWVLLDLEGHYLNAEGVPA